MVGPELDEGLFTKLHYYYQLPLRRTLHRSVILLSLPKYRQFAMRID